MEFVSGRIRMSKISWKDSEHNLHAGHRPAGVILIFEKSSLSKDTYWLPWL